MMYNFFKTNSTLMWNINYTVADGAAPALPALAPSCIGIKETYGFESATTTNSFLSP